MHPNLLLKIVALACSLLLVAGFVSYRAGALGWVTTPAPQPMAPPRAPDDARVAESAPEAPVVVPVETGNQTLFHGSKSAFVAEPLMVFPPVQPRHSPSAEKALQE